MTARSTYPIREGFFFDANTKIETSVKDLGVELKNVKTIRIIVVGAEVNYDGDLAYIRLYDDNSGLFYTITSDDLRQNSDANGVYIAHLRGALLDQGRYVYYQLDNNDTTIDSFSIYIDAVENVA
jgi:hypothetical protein